MQRMAPGVLRNDVQIVGGLRIAQHTDHCIGQRRIGRIVDGKFKEGGGDAGVFVVGGNQGIKGALVSPARKLIIVKGESANGYSPRKSTCGKWGSPVRYSRRGPQPKVSQLRSRKFALIGRLQIAVQNACGDDLAFCLRSSGPFSSARMAKWEKPLTLPLLGRL